EEIDARLIELEECGDRYVVDSHLAFHFIPSGFSVLLTVSPEQSAERIFRDAKSPTRIKSGDIMQTVEEARERTEHRIRNHIERYQKHYGVNPYDPTLYDLVIDTERCKSEETAEMILEAYTTWLSPLEK